jgi:hypothetical protein
MLQVQDRFSPYNPGCKSARAPPTEKVAFSQHEEYEQPPGIFKKNHFSLA